MENVNYQNLMFGFLIDDEAQEIFAKIDYQLKDGVHFQNSGNQTRYFGYIKRNMESLKSYYHQFFGVLLSEGGEAPDNYFYLDFYGNDRGNISSKHRNILKSEYVIIGFIIYKIVYIDLDVLLDSVQKLKEKIRIDYDDYKRGIYYLIAKSKNVGPGNVNDAILDSVIQSALQEFKKIGWITLEGDEFSLLPAFDRLIKIYEEYILDIDNTLNELK
ncbi:condensin complex protein MksE [Chryseobacterium sp. PET-29]|uniref:condensin complex protein MksE n=1 Tax=Chryseobacterium sp. PET-29 TaxID=2983267 RepID=UPI0021E59198|nr:hypothetical protein [Chryseobacterium sp. PET-29]